MNILNFTAEEANLIAIYTEPSRMATLARIREALRHMDAEFITLTVSASTKLMAMSDIEFSGCSFVLAEDEAGEVA